MNLTDHLQDLKEIVGGVIVTKETRSDLLKVSRILREAKAKNYQVLTFGNGGSHSNASHFACDLFKACGIRAICISDMIPSVYAYMNDDGIENMFLNIIDNLGMLENFVLIGFSCSGNSRNVVKALKLTAWGTQKNILFTGNDGGKAQESADVVIKVNHENIRIQESAHSIYCHAIVEELLSGT